MPRNKAFDASFGHVVTPIKFPRRPVNDLSMVLIDGVFDGSS